MLSRRRFDQRSLRNGHCYVVNGVIPTAPNFGSTPIIPPRQLCTQYQVRPSPLSGPKEIKRMVGASIQCIIIIIIMHARFFVFELCDDGPRRQSSVFI